jgi:hypothetical protein
LFLEFTGLESDVSPGRDGALRRPRRVQRRNGRFDAHVVGHSFRPLNAGGDIAARCSYQIVFQNAPLRRFSFISYWQAACEHRYFPI